MRAEAHPYAEGCICFIKYSPLSVYPENIGGFHPKDEIPPISWNLPQNGLSSGLQTIQDPKGDRLKNNIKAIAQRSADDIRNQIRDVRGAVKEGL